MEDYGSLSSYLKRTEIITEKRLVRHFLGTRRPLVKGDLDNVHWLPGLENPAGATTEVRSDVIPLLRLLESGASHPGILRPLRGVPAHGRAQRATPGSPS